MDRCLPAAKSSTRSSAGKTIGAEQSQARLPRHAPQAPRFLYSLAMSYPVSISVEPVLVNRNRLTTAFRFFLAIPHLILVGGVGIGIASGRGSSTSVGREGGLLGAVAFFLAI